MSEYSPWKVQVVRFWGEGWRWKLVNRRGETVMLSHNHPTEAGARASAEVEWDSLRSAVFIK